jgi:hypothetical protein
MSAQFERIRARIGQLTSEAASRKLAEIATARRDQIVAASDPKPEVKSWVDGAESDNYEAVKPNGTILMRFFRLNTAFDWIYQTLVQRSPYRDKRAGAQPATHYADEHVIFIDGQKVDEMPRDLSGINEVIIANLQPYARKIEKGLSVLAPDGVYEYVASEARAKFKGSVNIEFDYRVFPGAGPKGPAFRKARTPRSAAHDDRFPAIIITPVRL